MRTLVMVLALTTPAIADERHDRIRQNAVSLPDVKSEYAVPAVEAAIKHETEDLPAELLVSIMWGESRFKPNVRKGRVCGVMQVGPHDIGLPRSVCRTWEVDVDAAVADGVREMQMLLADRRVRGNIRRALMYRACGNSFFNGTCRKGGWARWVLGRAHDLRSQYEGKPVKAVRR